MITYSLDKLDNYQNWLKLDKYTDHRLRSQSYPVYFKFKGDRLGVSANIENENRLMSIKNNKTYFIKRRDRDLELQDNRTQSCTICFLYNPSNKTIDIEITNVNDILHGKFNRDTLRVFKVATLRHNYTSGRVLINTYNPHFDVLYNDHHIDDIKDIYERLIIFVDDLESILTSKSFMSNRELKRQKYAKLRSNKRSQRYKRLISK